MVKQVEIVFDDDVYDALEEFAVLEDREVDAQAQFIITNELKRRRFLPPMYNNPWGNCKDEVEE